MNHQNSMIVLKGVVHVHPLPAEGEGEGEEEVRFHHLPRRRARSDPKASSYFLASPLTARMFLWELSLCHAGL